MTRDDKDPQTYAMIGAAMAVHTELGAGFLEPVYQEALAIELGLRKIPFDREVAFEVTYKGYALNKKYIADFIAFESIVIECKALDEIEPAHANQLLNYLKDTGLGRGLLLNFGGPKLEYKRIVLNYLRPSAPSADERKDIYHDV